MLFQEHEIGVWVTRVVPDGNGARKGVQHGDQLAAINGASSVHTTIDEVASTISGTPSDIGVELTFLRYVGPLRPVPGSIIQEGFEVTDTSVSPKKMDSPSFSKATKSKWSLFSKRKSTNKVNSDRGSRSTPPSSPRRIALEINSKSPNQTNGRTTLQSSPKQGSQGSGPVIHSMPAASTQPPKQSTKKKITLGKKLMSFKKK